MQTTRLEPGAACKKFQTALVWFRRDLRSYDHAALYHALRDAHQVHCVFVFDTEILDLLDERHDRRVEFIWLGIKELDRSLRHLGGGLQVLAGSARHMIPALADRLGAQAVYANQDYEPAAKERDAHVLRVLGHSERVLKTYKDQVIFDKDEVLTKNGQPFTVFSAYKRAWLAKLNAFYCKAYPVDAHIGAFADCAPCAVPELEHIGFMPTDLQRLKLPTGMTGARALLQVFLGHIHDYGRSRNYPAIRGVSYLSAHLRFGTISIRELVRTAASMQSDGASAWLSELIWRDFYFSILDHFPHVVAHAFKPAYRALRFSNSLAHFVAWSEGRTGFPLVDAAMRQLNSSGYMHNRLRMVTASFLVKDLHVDWRWGEAYFARKLIDYDLAANNGGWQWSASTGCDAQPWFRIFNPTTQSRTYDPQGRFIRMYVPELAPLDAKFIHEPWIMSAAEQESCGVQLGKDYPFPLVDHATARRKTLAIYGAVRSP